MTSKCSICFIFKAECKIYCGLVCQHCYISSINLTNGIRKENGKPPLDSIKISKSYIVQTPVEIYSFFKTRFNFNDEKSFMSSTEIYDIVHTTLPNISYQKMKEFLTSINNTVYMRKKINGVLTRGYLGIRPI